MPLVSVIIPTHNRPQYLKEALESVKAQTFTDYEIIVVINGPDTLFTECSLNLSKSMGCVSLRTKKQGIAVALNTGITQAKGKFIAFLDDDDLWEPRKLQIQITMMQRYEADLSFCDVIPFGTGESHHPQKLAKFPNLSAAESLMLSNIGGGCSVTIARRSKILEAGGFWEGHASPDHYLWVSIAWVGNVIWVDRALVRYRNHTNNNSKSIKWTYWNTLTRTKILWNCPKHLNHMRLKVLLRSVIPSAKNNPFDEVRYTLSRITGVNLLLYISGLKYLERTIRKRLRKR
jgi:glycosyltransferase involved in cell wall biosynthesis